MNTLSTTDELLQLSKVCVQNLTKNLGGNPKPVFDYVRWRNIKPSLQTQCADGCAMIAVHCTMIAPVVTYTGTQLAAEEPDTEPCESDVSKLLDNGVLTVENMVLVFKKAPPKPGQVTESWRLRGAHAGKFKWVSVNAAAKPVEGYVISGQMAGLNSIGIYRNPALPRNGVDGSCCADSCNSAFLHGRLYGVAKTSVKKFAPLNGALVDAIYRISYDTGPGHKDPVLGPVPDLVTSGRGVLHGILLPKCR